MIALEVSVNGRKIALAGAEDLVVMSAIISAVGKLGSKSRGTTHKPRAHQLFLDLGGLTGRTNDATDEHVRWTPRDQQRLAIGDEVRVRIVRTKSADEPKTRRAAKPAKSKEEDARARFEWAKEVYLAEREKYEPSAEPPRGPSTPAPRARRKPAK